MAQRPDVGRVVGPDGGADGGTLEQLFPRELLEVGHAEQHEVDDVLGDDGADLVEEGRARLHLPRGSSRGVSDFAAVGEAEAHVGILGVAEDEVPGPGGVGLDAGELLVESGRGHAGQLSSRRRGITRRR